MKYPDGVHLVGVNLPPDGSREQARVRVREALLQAFGGARLLPAHAGQAPRLWLAGYPAAGLSISHEAGFSVAAVNLHGPVGVDVMAVQDIPDWQAVALDYLGPGVAAQLYAAPLAQRAGLFARAWCQREAGLKYAGAGLHEWSAGVAPTCRLFDLSLPGGRVGALALPRDSAWLPGQGITGPASH